MSGAETISARDVEYSGWKMTLHLNYGAGGYGYQYQSVKFPSVRISITRKKRKDRETRSIFVGDMEVPHFGAAAEILNAKQTTEEAQS